MNYEVSRVSDLGKSAEGNYCPGPAVHCELQEQRGWGGVNLILGGLMHDALQATGTDTPLIMPILNLVPRREALLSPQFL